MRACMQHVMNNRLTPTQSRTRARTLRRTLQSSTYAHVATSLNKISNSRSIRTLCKLSSCKMSARAAKTTAIEGGVANGVGNGTFPGLGATETTDGSRTLVDALKLATCAGSGVIFGMAAEKGKVFIPAVIQNQMTFSQFTMMKMFLSAVAAGLGSFIILNLLPKTHNLFSNMRDSFGSCVRSKRIIAIVVGGTLLGVGMTLSGSCPGMVLLQLGAGTQNAVYTLAGSFTGALLYGAMEPALSGVLFHKRAQSANGVWLDKLFGLPYTYMAVPLAIILGGIILAIEYLVPWTTEVSVSPATVGILEQKSWPPILAGLLMGSLQLSVVFSVGDSLGGSSSYCTVLSHTGGRALSYFRSFRSGIGNWWQVAFWLGGIAGAGLSAHLSGTWGTAAGVAPLLGFLGGASMLFGARMASGCTSGHGLSGLSLLSTASFAAVPAMFAGAMGLAFALGT